MKVLVFGNSLLAQDNLPLLILDKLRESFPEIEFKEFDPNDDLEKEGRELTIIDTVEGIKKATLITDTNKIIISKLYSMHDFDLGQSLRLLKKMKYIDSVKIFGVPMGMKKKEALEQLTSLLHSSLS